MRKSIFLSAAVFLLGTSASYAACEFTEAPPTLPDGNSATEAQMVAAQDAVKIYMDHSNAYIACLQQEDRQAGDEDTLEAEAARLAAHNQAVDDQQKLADDFNAQLRAFKAQAGQ